MVCLELCSFTNFSSKLLFSSIFYINLVLGAYEKFSFHDHHASIICSLVKMTKQKEYTLFFAANSNTLSTPLFHHEG